MRTPIVECVPNFSEGRRSEVINAIVQAISSVEEIYLLDISSDYDHNRSVITFAGSPQDVEEAAFRAIKTAGELINLDIHSGEHPRIGASDVVPFIPIWGVSMDDCIGIANRLGKRVGESLSIPVYLYEQAAKTPARKNLENIRSGEYEHLKEEIATNPLRKPDFGPASLGSAGATVIGARSFLIAYNVYLTTDDVDIAKKIALAVRHSGGGLRFVKALGLLVDGRAQVSMNLTNFQKTPLARVVELIRREALRYGTAIHHSELVGLIPQEALVDASVWYTQMDQFKPDQVFESKLFDAIQKGIDTPEFLDELAAGTPTPGGGSASAYSGAMAAGLVCMVARLTIGKKKYADVEEQNKEILIESECLRDELKLAVEQDSKAFNDVMAAYRLPKTEAKRPANIQKAVLRAAEIPLMVAQKCLRVLELAVGCASIGNSNAITDAGSGAALARAAITGAGYNIRINVLSITDEIIANRLLDEIRQIDEKTVVLMRALDKQLTNRGGLALG